MSSSFLTHTRKKAMGAVCGGSIVLDVTGATKVYAPSFTFETDKLGSLLLDVDVVQSGSIIPRFFCKSCGEQFTAENLAGTVSAHCQICGKSTPVDSLQMHPAITCICNKCVSDIKEHFSGNGGSSRIADYVVSFGLTSRMRLVPLMTILSSPVTI